MEEEEAIKILENIRSCLSLNDWKEKGLEITNQYIEDLQTPKNKKTIWTLQNIKVLLKNKALFETREYIKMELENLKGLSEKNYRNRY